MNFRDNRGFDYQVYCRERLMNIYNMFHPSDLYNGSLRIGDLCDVSAINSAAIIHISNRTIPSSYVSRIYFISLSKE